MVALAGLLITGLARVHRDGARHDHRRRVRRARLAHRAAGGARAARRPHRQAAASRSSRRRRARAAGAGAWAAIARVVTRHPAAALVTAVCLLGALAVPALDMQPVEHAARPRCPRDSRSSSPSDAIERAFPGAPERRASSSSRGASSTRRRRTARLRALGAAALAVTGGRGSVGVETARDGRTAVVVGADARPRHDAAERTVAALRDRVAPTAAQRRAGRRGARDRRRRPATPTSRTACASRTPIVIAFVLGLAFVLLLAAFRSLALAPAVVGAEPAVGRRHVRDPRRRCSSTTGPRACSDFTSNGTVVDWLPLFAFVILFGLSMDYTILVLERIREARRAGPSAARGGGRGRRRDRRHGHERRGRDGRRLRDLRDAAPASRYKQLGVGLAAAILIDATLVRGVALPAAVALLGDRGWRVASRPAPARPVPIGGHAAEQLHERAGGPAGPRALRRLTHGARVARPPGGGVGVARVRRDVVWALTAGDGDFLAGVGVGRPRRSRSPCTRRSARAWRRPPGPSRRLAVQAAVSLVLARHRGRRSGR